MCAPFKVLNLSNVADWLGEAPFLEKDGFHPVNMVSVPIFNGQRDVIGVAQLINKVGKSFSFVVALVLRDCKPVMSPRGEILSVDYLGDSLPTQHMASLGQISASNKLNRTQQPVQ